MLSHIQWANWLAGQDLVFLCIKFGKDFFDRIPEETNMASWNSVQKLSAPIRYSLVNLKKSKVSCGFKSLKEDLVQCILEIIKNTYVSVDTENFFYHWRYTNADLKISLYVCVYTKITPWKFRILNHKDSWVIHP